MASSKKLIPYGISDFEKIRLGNYYYVDKTEYIRRLEDYNYVLFLRPRRFGKSLLVNMLKAYYDVNYADKFEALFGSLAIGRKPTDRRNSYLMLSFNFSRVDSNPDKVQESFNDIAIEQIEKFISRYDSILPKDTKSIVSGDGLDCSRALSRLNTIVGETNNKIYITIDEYDNFANTLMSVDQSSYNEILHADGLVRLFYNVLKEATTDNSAAIDRIFITGVSPLCLSDVTSGFNIAANISTEQRFNAMVGFTSNEVRKMFEYYSNEYGDYKHTADELIETIKPFYDNYCFSKESAEHGDDHLFNSDMTLYFLRKYNDGYHSIPDEMIDENNRSDPHKMAAVLRNGGNEAEKIELIQQILDDGYYDCDLKTQFQVRELGNIRNLVSLLFYLGLLTYGRTQDGDVSLIVANETMRQQQSDYLSLGYAEVLQWSTDVNKMDKLWTKWAKRGEWQPFVEYVLSVMHDNDSVRDHNYDGEAFVKGFLLAHICHGNGYAVKTEAELDHGYSDIYMYPISGYKHALVIELKYLHREATSAAVTKKAEEARKQIREYISDKRILTEAKTKGWTLHAAIAVVRGWDAEIIEQVTEVG